MKPSQLRDHYLANNVCLVTRDLDEARESVGQMWERHRSVLKRGRRYFLRWHQADRGATSLSYARTSSALAIDCGPVSDTYRITLHEAGRLRHVIDGRQTVSSPKTAVLHAPGQELSLETEPFALLILTFEGGFVRRAFEHRRDRLPPSDAWPREFPLSTPPGQALTALTRWTALEFDRPGGAIAPAGGAWRHVQQTLLTLFLDCVAAPAAATKAPRADLTEARVRLIEDWVAAHVSEPIGVEDLARVAGVSVRSVQTAFQRLRGCTPTQMVTRQRLDAANAMLRRGGPEIRVTDVALDCGFFNFGRFAARYRATFGETPSQTRARRDA